jgi:hypothetical protein
LLLRIGINHDVLFSQQPTFSGMIRAMYSLEKPLTLIC